MSTKFASTLVILSILLLASSNTAFCQSAAKENSQEEPSELSSDEFEPITAQAVLDVINKNDFDLATKMIDAGIAQAAPAKKIALQRMRKSLAEGLGRAREYDKAYTQGEKYIRAMLEQDKYATVSTAFFTLSRFLRYGNRVDKADSGYKLAIDTLAKADQITASSPTQFIYVMQSLVPVCVSQVVKVGNEDLANKILTEKIASLDALNTEGRLKIEYLIARTKLLQSRVSLPSSTEASAKELKKFIDESNAIHPGLDSLVDFLYACRNVYDRGNAEQLSTRSKKTHRCPA